jgi:hypothetical protein
MTPFDLLFIALVLVSLGTLITAAVTALRRQGSRALRILGRLGICAAAYVGVVIVVALLAPQRVLNVGDPWCFDDWCLSVENVNRTAAPAEVTYDVSLRLFSRARRVSQRAMGAWVYAIDGRGNRYAPEPAPSSVPLDILLQPGESVRTSRVFKVPAGVGELGLITGHGPSGISTFIIGDQGSLFHKRTFIRLK